MHTVQSRTAIYTIYKIALRYYIITKKSTRYVTVTILQLHKIEIYYPPALYIELEI